MLYELSKLLSAISKKAKKTVRVKTEFENLVKYSPGSEKS